MLDDRCLLSARKRLARKVPYSAIDNLDADEHVSKSPWTAADTDIRDQSEGEVGELRLPDQILQLSVIVRHLCPTDPLRHRKEPSWTTVVNRAKQPHW